MARKSIGRATNNTSEGGHEDLKEGLFSARAKITND